MPEAHSHEEQRGPLLGGDTRAAKSAKLFRVAERHYNKRKKNEKAVKVASTLKLGLSNQGPDGSSQL